MIVDGQERSITAKFPTIHDSCLTTLQSVLRMIQCGRARQYSLREVSF